MALTLHTPQRPIAPTRKAHQTRIEHDCIGSAEIPAEAYWGIHTLRAIDNFPVSGIPVSDHPELIRLRPRQRRTQQYQRISGGTHRQSLRRRGLRRA